MKLRIFKEYTLEAHSKVLGVAIYLAHLKYEEAA